MSIKTLLKFGKKIASFRSIYVVILLIGVSLIMGYFSNWAFFKEQTLRTMFRITPETGLISVGMALLLISGEFDLSVGSIFLFSSAIAALTFSELNWNPFLGLLFTLALCALLGYVNGMIVTKSGVSSLVVTLGTMWAFRGITLVITGGTHIYYHPEISSPIFKGILVGTTIGIPNQIIWLIVVTAVLYVLLEHTWFGNHVFSTGSNKISSQMMGINTDRVKTICFMIVGVLSGFAGIMTATRIGGHFATLGRMKNLEAIAAAVVGGTSIYGGTGSIPGSALGALTIIFLDTGLLAIGLSMWHFYIALGSTLIAFVSLNIWFRRRRGS